jgi:hypothetical protein
MQHDPKPIKKAMVDMDIETADELATLAGVSRPTALKILKGKTVMPQKLEAVLNAVGLQPADVYPALPNQRKHDDSSRESLARRPPHGLVHDSASFEPNKLFEG